MPTLREPIRLVIWDLDETLWRGTLEEGEVFVPPEHVEIIQVLARRGIISSICSKNDHAAAKARLEASGVWEWIVFPRIEYTFKSNLVADIVDQVGLRPETILFIDDNPFNRGEVEERVPGINVVSEAIIPDILDHPLLQGKPDDALTRLERYRVLQSKQAAFTDAKEPIEFLRSCAIVISFHFDIEAVFDRIHELVNRTNQLNFTKLRWKEGVAEARAEYGSHSARVYGTHAGYVKVRDRYGYYGICGFFETQLNGKKLSHFLFSCRVLNMGVEQFVYQHLNFPHIKLEGNVVARVGKDNTVDWITLVPDAELHTGPSKPQSDATVCLHGPCELVQSAHYLRPFVNAVEEFQYPKQGWGIIRPLLRYLLLEDELKDLGLRSCKDLGLPADFPGFDFAALGSAFFHGQADICVWSFSLETQIAIYRHKETGLAMPISLHGFDDKDVTKFPFDIVSRRAKHVKIEHFRAVKRNFEFVGHMPAAGFASDLKSLRTKVKRTGKPFIVVDVFDDLAKIDRLKYRKNAHLNKLVRDALEGLPNVHHIPFAACVTNASEQIVVNHFSRGPYIKLADRIRETIASLENGKSLPGAAA
ncbi:MAG TPA: HAD-IIIC family phosphatase [Rhizomicrobium sp.]|jgi:FkbH-like protein|nr:HAD-IIIC family phosphatase [Rhizomicrobium sp.]